MMKQLSAFLLGLFLTGPALADSTIDLLGAGAALTGTEKLPMFQTANPAVTTTPNALKTFVTTSGVVTSITNSDGTLTFTGTSAVVGSLALGHANTWTAVQSFTNGDLSLLGATSGNTLLEATAVAGAGTIATFPANTGTVAELNLAQTWSAVQTFSASNGIVYSGATVGTQVACIGLDGSNNLVKNAAACGLGTVTSISAGCGTSSGGSPITTTGTIFAAEVPNLRAGTTYTIANADCGTLNNFSNAAAIAVTLPQAGSGGNFANGWYNDVCSIGAGTATITPTTSTIGGVATLVLTTGKCARIVSDGTNYQVVTYGGGGGGGTPGGATTNVQFNNAGAFGGDAGFTYTTLGQVTIAGGTITTNNKALTITQTWNNGAVKFDAPLLTNITMTAADSSSALMDIQAGGVSLLQLQNQYVGAFLNRALLVMPISSVIAPATGGVIYFGGPVVAGNGVNNFGSSRWAGFSSSGGAGIVQFGGGSKIDWYYGNNDIAAATGVAVSTYADGTNVVQTNAIAIGNTATATGFRVYNTTDASGQVPPTNFERINADFTTSANIGTIGTQQGGTGTGRQMILRASGLFSAAGVALPTCNTTAGGGYPTGTKGAIAVVSDATSPTYNANYTSGGAVTALVVCNGTNWVTQ